MELDRLLAAARRRWYLIAAFIVFGAALGLLATSGRTERFIAEATVEVGSDRNVYGSNRVLERIVVNEMDFITSLDLRNRVTRAVGSGIDAETDMTVAQRTDTDVVDLRVEGPEADAAIAAVNFWADSWLREANERKTGSLDAAILAAEAALTGAESALADSDDRVDQLLERDRSVTIADLFAANPSLATEQARRNDDVQAARTALVNLRAERSKITPFAVVSRAAAPATPARDGTGLGPTHGALIGLVLSLALVVGIDRNKVMATSATQITSTFWPDVGQRDDRRVLRLGQELRRSFVDDRLQLVGFSSTEGRSHTKALTLGLAVHFAEHGHDVTLLTDDADEQRLARMSDVQILSRARVGDVVDLASRELSDLRGSIVFANFEDLWYLRSHVGDSGLIALIDVRLGDDSETVVAESVSRARAMTPTVIAVAA